MNYDRAIAKLNSIQQPHLLNYWHELNEAEKNLLLQQIENLDIAAFHEQQAVINARFLCDSSVDPFLDYQKVGSLEDALLGKEAIEQGRLGCLIVAGGQGTRLHLEGPKGLYPISLIRHKSLFQLFSEKIVAASKLALHPLQAAIMTSPLNHERTLAYFKTHAYFQLRKEQLDFFAQPMLPFLDNAGNLFLEKKGLLAEGPNGNGACLHQFWEEGLLAKWKKMGIEHLNFVMIDNPLADPFDAELFGMHIRNQNDITIKCTLRVDPEEKVGVIVKQHQKVQVIEYTEFPESERYARLSDGSLKHPCANISLFCISLSFIEKICDKKRKMPLHALYKKTPSLIDSAQKGWKFEHFIFDIFPLADKIQALLYPRERCFAPLKNLSGQDSPASVQDALQARDRQLYEELFSKKAPLVPFELAQDFYYPIPSYVDQWKNHALPPEGYFGDIGCLDI
jgi:UDP-N-acetylglucosamine/UDP-N-acetylgalactosamine diphosphorylase